MSKWITVLLLVLLSCFSYAQSSYILVLGTAQDGGYPHMGCDKECCKKAWADLAMRRWVVSLALVDPATNKWWLFEATPDIKEQLHYFQVTTGGRYPYLPEGIFVTHAHIGHYTGLMELGREVINTKDERVYALPRMDSFLTNNGPWGQLVSLHNIALVPLLADSAIQLTADISVKAFTVPHRDEYAETAGFVINTGSKKYLFIPDINKWDKWDKDIRQLVRGVDIALLDGTFYDGDELPGRSMSEVPHPFVQETMELFRQEDTATKSKLYFIHFNHTNPLLWDPAKKDELRHMGFQLADQGSRL